MKTALITGASRRIGKQITITLHLEYNIIIHYNTSKVEAQKLADELNKIRVNSAKIISADLNNISSINALTDKIDKLDLLVNNASIFYPTTIDEVDEDKFLQLMGVNVLAPLILSKNLSKKLKNGNIVNIVDIHSQRPLKNYIIYNISKAGIEMLTKTLAKDLAPDIRVNGVSPGSILWPENSSEINNKDKSEMLNRIALNAQGSPNDIAKTVLFLAKSDYITGQIISVDGGRTLNQ